MLMNIVLSMLLLVLLVFSLLIHQNDFLHPGVLAPAAFLFSSIMCFYGNNTWQAPIHANTVALICLGVFLFIAGSSFGSVASIANEDNVTTKLYASRLGMKPQPFLLFVITILCVGITALQTSYVVQIARTFTNSDTWTNLMWWYRQTTSYSVSEDDLSLPKWLNWARQLCNAFGYVYLLMGVAQFMARKYMRGILCFLPAIIMSMAAVLSAARMQILYYAAAAAAFYGIMSVVYSHKQKSQAKNNAIVMRLVIAFCAVLAIFSALRAVVGRGLSEKSASDPLYYISVYAGAPIPLLDAYLQEDPERSPVFGMRTFFSLNNTIGRNFNIPDLQYIQHLEMRESPTGFQLGNVYTAFRVYYSDFGIVGLALFTFLSALIFTALYTWAVRSLAKGDPRALLVYGFLFPGVILMPIVERLFSVFLSPWAIETLIFILLIGQMMLRPAKIRPHPIVKVAQNISSLHPPQKEPSLYGAHPF